jgi:hypothetical protein
MRWGHWFWTTTSVMSPVPRSRLLTVRADTSAATPRLCHPRHRPPSLRHPTLDHTTTVTEGG